MTNTKELAETLQISQIKVQRVLKEQNLGKRLVKNSEETRKALYMYNIGYIIVHPDQKGKTAAETFSDKAAALGFENECFTTL